MIIDEKFGRSYNMTREAAVKIVTADVPMAHVHLGAQPEAKTPACFWCGREGGLGHFNDCVFFIADRVIQLTDSPDATGSST